jgi:acyl-CoA oxidase
VAKELLADVSKGTYELPTLEISEEDLPKVARIDDLTVLKSLIALKLNFNTDALVQSMSQKVLIDKKSLFEVWMQEDSDLVQQVAHAYGDNLVFAHCCDMGKAGEWGTTNAAVMERLVVLYGLGIVEQNLAWYLFNGAVSPALAKTLADVRSGVVKSLAPYANAILEGFKVGDTNAPIAGDYLEYNSKPNNGELGPAPRL